MTDDLVKRLREGATWDDDIAAADRIEQLAATNDELEAKLANAVKCQHLNDCIEMVDELYDSSLAAKARTTLAELKGEQP